MINSLKSNKINAPSVSQKKREGDIKSFILTMIMLLGLSGGCFAGLAMLDSGSSKTGSTPLNQPLNTLKGATMINAGQLRQFVVIPELKRLGLHSKAAENLLMGTAAQESKLGEYLVQLGNGPARGIFQMERATEKDIWINYLAYQPKLAAKVLAITATLTPYYQDEILYNLRYAAAMCRIHYLRKKEKLPDQNDVGALGKYWKDHYNTHLGRGTVAEFKRNYIHTY